MNRPGVKGVCAQIIDFAGYKRRHDHSNLKRAIYVSQNGEWTAMLSRYVVLPEQPICSSGARSKIISFSPDLIFVESQLSWYDPVEIVLEYNRLYRVPIVMISIDTPSEREVVKRAYLAGACDTLLAPLRGDELAETINILLKFKDQLSLYH